MKLTDITSLIFFDRKFWWKNQRYPDQKKIHRTSNGSSENSRKLKPKQETSFDLREVSIQQTYDVISEMSGTNAQGLDYVKSRVLKFKPNISSLWMINLYINIVRTNRFRKILKTMGILPLLKLKKIETVKRLYIGRW